MGRLSVAIVMPSRGLVNSRTVEGVMDNILDGDFTFSGWYLTHDLPMPLGHERAAEAATSGQGADLLWFVEDDVIPPSGALYALKTVLDEGYGVAAIDYPVGAASDAWGCIVRDPAGDILWCGLGCTLIPTAVLDMLAQPWFTTDWRYVRDGDGWRAERVTVPEEQRYGQFDIHLCHRLRERGFHIGQVSGMIARHARIESLGPEGTNVGTHRIGIRDRIERPWPGPSA